MNTVYVVTENQSFIDLIKQSEENLKVNFLQSQSIKKPQDSLLTDIWARQILETEINNIVNSSSVIFDLDCKDKVGLFIMIGFALGMRKPIKLANNKDMLPYEYMYDDGSYLNLNSDLFKGDSRDIEIKLLVNEMLSDDVKFDIDLTSIDHTQLVLLGAAYIRRHEIRIVHTKINPVLYQMTNNYLIKE